MLSSEDNVEDEFFVDPELEKIRSEGLLEGYVDYEKLTKDLCEEVEGIHSAYLFHPEGKDVRKEICICITANPDDPYHSSWKDLAGELGLSFGQICCIDKYNKDYTELVLMTFCQKSDAALTQLVNAFLNIKLYNALSIASKKFPALAEFVRKDYEHKMEKSGYFPNVVQEDGKKKLITPQGLRHLRESLHITLQDVKSQTDKLLMKKQPIQVIAEKDFTENIKRRIEVMQIVNAAPTERGPIELLPQIKHRRYGKRVMLTFASDCLDVAQILTQELRMDREGLLPFKVLRLDEHEESVNLNPAQFIAHQFAKMDYIIPILSERYFDILCNERGLHATDYLDESYIRLLFDHMNVYYLDNRCLNYKIRCIIPKRFKNSVFNHSHFKLYQFFRAFTSDDPEEVQRLLVRLAKSKHRRM